MFDFLIDDVCAEGSPMLFIFKLARWLIRIIQIAVPFALIIFGSLDFFKALMANDEKEMRMKRKPFVKRIIVSIIIILLPTLVNLLLKKLAANTNNRFAECWNLAGDYKGAHVDDSQIWNDDTDEEDMTGKNNAPKNNQGISKRASITIGDKVIIINGENSGKTGEVKATYEGTNGTQYTIEYKYKDENGNEKSGRTTVSESDIIKEISNSSSSQSKFKIGDKVMISDGEYSGNKGEIISQYTEDSGKIKYRIKFTYKDSNGNEKTDRVYKYEDQITKSPESESNSNVKYSTGDKVEVISGKYKGTIGTIKLMYDNQKVKIEYTEQIYKTEKIDLKNLKIGYRVKILIGDNKGKIGKITKITEVSDTKKFNILLSDNKTVTVTTHNTESQTKYFELVTSIDEIVNTTADYISVNDIKKVN